MTKGDVYADTNLKEKAKNKLILLNQKQMKKIKFLLPLLFILGFLGSCNEDELIERQEDVNAKSVTVISLKTVGDPAGKGPELTTSGTMLSFASFEEYQETISALEQQMEAYDDAFLTAHNTLTVEQLDNLEDSIGYNPQQPLIDFENSVGFSNSLRKKYNQLENIWLDNEELDPETDPDNTILFDEIEQTLWNEHQEIMIEGKVFVLGKSLDAFQINANYASNLELINMGEDISDNPDIIITEKGGACTTWRSNKDFENYAANKRIKRVITIRSVSWLCMTSAKTVSYKKKGSKWKIKRTSIGAGLQIYLKGSNCDNTIRQGYKYKSVKNKRQRVARMYEWGQSPAYRAKNSQSLYGTYYRGGSSSSKVLAW